MVYKDYYLPKTGGEGRSAPVWPEGRSNSQKINLKYLGVNQKELAREIMEGQFSELSSDSP